MEALASASVSFSGMAAGLSARLCCSSLGHQRMYPVEKNKMRRTLGDVKLVFALPKLRKTSTHRPSFLIQASAGETEESNSVLDDMDKASDFNYLAKLGAGTVAAAAAIKYGSILFPEFTSPNIAQAVFMILFPVFIAVLLLIRQSYAKHRN